MDILRGAFRRWTTCLLNDTSSKILKNFVSLPMVLAYVVGETMGLMGLLRSESSTGLGTLLHSVLFHWFLCDLGQSSRDMALSDISPFPRLQKKYTSQLVECQSGIFLCKRFYYKHWWKWHFRKWERVSPGRDISGHLVNHLVLSRKRNGSRVISCLLGATYQSNLHQMQS